MKWLADCVGYACGPEHGTPAGEVIVKVTSHLANTGADGNDWAGYVIVGLILAVVGVGLLSQPDEDRVE